MDIHETQHFKEMLYKPIILAMGIHTGLLMKHCVLTSWKYVVVHEQYLVAMNVHGQFRLGRLKPSPNDACGQGARPTPVGVGPK